MELIIKENKPTICLNMIVKNESHIIGQTLEKLCNKINFDYWVICDTGSTDSTPETITNFFNTKNIKGELHHDEWVNFAHNRTIALEKAYKKTEMLLVFDADDEIVGDIIMPEQVLFDEYHLKFGSSFGTAYTRVILINNYKRFKYLSVIHEFITCKEPGSKSTVIEGDYFVVSGRSGSRNNDPDKYLKDAFILEKAYLEALSNNDELFHRYSYYCANSYKDCGRFEEAIKWYLVTLNHEKQWAQEKYTACMYIYECYNNLKKPEIGFFYLVKAFAYDPDRVECLFPLLVHYCCENMYNVAYNYYLNVKDYFENKYLEDDISKKLFVVIDKFNFFVPYYMILIADKVQDFKCVVRMYEIIFQKKQLMLEEWYVKNLLYNLQFFLQYVPSNNKTFIPLANNYFLFLYNNGINLQNFDFLIKHVYANAGIILDYIFVKEVTNKTNKYSKDECEKSKNILFYTGFSDIEWNYTYMLHNAIGGSEKAVAYLTKCFPKEYNIFVSGHVKNEQIDNVQYIHLDRIKNIIDTTPFHTVIVSRYISFYEMFQHCSYYQSFIWAHDVLLLPYGCNLQENQILIKWHNYIHGCICLTEWQQKLFSEKYPLIKEKIHIINNGIDVSTFKSTFNKIPNKFIYSSRPDRGLNILLELWPKIIEQIPDATLSISSYGLFPSTPQDFLLKDIIDKYDSIQFLGKLNTEQLYNEMSTADFWLYPTHWPETSCITALEMLMSEVVCLYYPVAGLVNTMDTYGIEIKNGNEIDEVLRLTNKDKLKLKENGRKYAQSCSWENRAKIWFKLLSIIDIPKETTNEIITVIPNITFHIQTNKKNIAIFNSFPFHYEMFGYIIQYSQKYDYKLSIFTSNSNSLGWLEFYKQFFKNYNFEYKNISDFEKEKNNFDNIFITTDDDYAFNTEWINDKCICIDHISMIRRPEYKYRLGTRPFIKNLRDWTIPCFTAFGINDKTHINEPDINITIIGGLNDYNYDVINRLNSEHKIKLHIIARYANYFDVTKIKNKIETVIHNNINTFELFSLLKKGDYIFTDSTFNTHHSGGISMSGNIPLSFSTLTPLIITSFNNSMYKFKNVVEFDLMSQDKINITKGMIDINLLEEERQMLIDMLPNYINNIISSNIDKSTIFEKNTALIVEPRYNDCLVDLIQDYQQKLGDDWQIVFYCGKDLKHIYEKELHKAVEIRELNVNNFTLHEYSDFMKNKDLWLNLYGKYVLTFQADTFIYNKEPYTIDYFMNMNRSYIGGNMDHGWNELTREKLQINYRNFNGGLSLRIRSDMIKIIDQIGVEKTQNNSTKIQTDAEDVYFTIGCYKLGLQVGDINECMNFSMNRIWTEQCFGVHKPMREMLQKSSFLRSIFNENNNCFTPFYISNADLNVQRCKY